ncbi:MAG: M20 metallopeptidase family protein [Acidimicrobiales bacterium]
MTFAQQAAAVLPELIRLRRAIHADPELGLDLPRTQQRVLQSLEPDGLETMQGTALSSVVAVLRGAEPGPTVLLRADMDALPLHETTGVPYAFDGSAMHACGHDMHVAGLVGAAHLLSAQRDAMKGNVVFMFQPGEEGHNGASLMIQEGVLQAGATTPEAAYGIHVVPGQRGIFSTRPGTLMASAAALRVRVHGRGGHASAPHRTVDPVPVIAELVTALQAFVTRRFDVFDPVVVSVTRLSAGDALNVVPPSAELGGTIRTLSTAALEQICREIPPFIELLAGAHNCKAEVEVAVGYPPTVNDSELATRALRLLADSFGDTRVRESQVPVMGSEDFSYVLQSVPGTFIFFGAGPSELDEADAAPLHSPQVRFDDDVLADQAIALAQLAWSHVGS